MQKSIRLGVIVAPFHKLVQGNFKDFCELAQRYYVGRAVTVFVIAYKAFLAAQLFCQLALRHIQLFTVISDIFRYFSFHLLYKSTINLYNNVKSTNILYQKEVNYEKSNYKGTVGSY